MGHRALARRDNAREAYAVAQLYAHEDSDRGFLARQFLHLVDELLRLVDERMAATL